MLPYMVPYISAAYARDMDMLAAVRENRTIDISTIGARSGEPRRIETWAWPLDGVIYLTGSPGRRDWYANLKAHPGFTLHLKRGVTADVSAHARPVEESAERRDVFTRMLADSGYDLEAWIARSPLVEVELRP
jgi:deazaflavin-dependent oxidoreductase (nitroreductase family)